MKKKIKNLKENKKLFLAFSSLGLLFLIGTTMAIIYLSVQFQNQFITLSYNVGMEEEFYNDFGTKKVSIVNYDDVPVIIRVHFSELWSQQGSIESLSECKVSKVEIEEGTLLTLSNKIHGVDVVNKGWTDAWRNDFVRGNDGWYYYKKVLHSRDKVQILNTILLNEDLVKNTSCYQNYSDYDYSLDFNYEAVQATSIAVKDIWGHSIAGGDITWDF